MNVADRFRKALSTRRFRFFDEDIDCPGLNYPSTMIFQKITTLFISYFDSNQIKSPSDNPRINPHIAKSIDPIVKELDANSHKEDFEIYDKIIEKFSEFENMEPENVKKEIEKDIGNIIYINPKNYNILYLCSCRPNGCKGWSKD